MNHTKLRSLQWIRRFNFEPCIHYQTVAEHSFFVAVLAEEVAMKLGYTKIYIYDILDAALLHDATEAILGDIPYLVRKNMAPEELLKFEKMAMEELDIENDVCSEEMLGIVYFCDILELAIYLKEERVSGNQALNSIYEETIARLVNHFLWGRLNFWVMDLLGYAITAENELLKYKNTNFKQLKH